MFCNKMLAVQQLYRRAGQLALITIFYNFAEGIISVGFGAEDETIALFGFGLDSFVEVISGIGIWPMVRRLGTGGVENPDPFERRALQITGTAFYLLAAGLTVSAVISALQGHHPVTTRWGTIIAIISIISMQLLIHYKVIVGTALNSAAILADAACTRTCLRLSVVLLITSVGYTITGISYLDAIGSLLIAVLSFREGREALQQAKGLACSCAGNCSG